MSQIRGNTQIKAGTIFDAQLAAGAGIQTSKLADGAEFLKRDGSVALTADLNANGFQLSGLALATQANQAATWGQVQSISQGLQLKEACRLATTTNIDLATGGLLSVDGVTTVAGDRVLVKAQTNAVQNGIYVAAAGAWTRSADADGQPDPNNEVKPGMFTFVTEGALHEDTGWVLATNGEIVVGTTELVFTQFSAAGVIGAGNGLEQNGTELSVKADGASLSVSAAGVKVADLGVTNAMLAGSIETSKLAEGAELVKRDGTVAFTGDIDAGTHKVVNVVAGTAATDAVNKGQMEAAIAAIDVSSQIAPIQAEIDAIEAGAGLGTNGAYVPHTEANYISEASSLANADSLLDAQIKVVADAVADLESTGVGALQTEVDAIETAAGLNADGTLPAYTGTNYLDAAASLRAATLALDTQAKANADAVATKASQTEVDAIETGAGLETDGTYVAPVGTNYLGSATSLKGADVLLDTQIKSLADNKLDKSAVSTDATFATPSDTEVPSTQAVKTFLEGRVADSAVGFVDDEVPGGTVNGVNTSFTLAGVANPPESVHLYINGLRTATATVTPGETTTTFTVAVAPSTGDSLSVDYRI